MAKAKTAVQRLKEKNLAIEEAQADQTLRDYELSKTLVHELERFPLIESTGWGDVVDFSDRYQWDNTVTGQAEPLPSRPDDRRNGDNRPFWENEFELRRILGIARHVATFNEVGLGAIDIYVKYVVGTGFEFGIEYEQDPEAAKRVEAWVDEWDERVGFTGEMDEEIKKRELRDGDYFAWINPIPNGKASLRIFEPDEVTEPADPMQLEDYYQLPGKISWKYGIATDARDTSVIYGYFVSWNGDPTDTQFVPAEQVVHVKRNVDRRVKRGVSDFYCVWQELRNAEKLLRNMTHGASIQASIALIRNHDPSVTKAQINDIQSAIADRVTSTKGTTQYLQDIQSGQIVDQGKCQTEFGPMGTLAGQNYELILQAAYRTVGLRWHMPEYMISGDASNGSFSSTLVAESPFVKTAEVEQSRTGKAFNRMRKIVARMGAAAGRIPGVTVEMIDAMKFTAEGVRIASRERDKDIAADKILVDSGAMSIETLAARNDLDHEDEKAKGAAPLAPTASPGLTPAAPTEAVRVRLGDAIARLREDQAKGCSCGCEHGVEYT